MIDFDNMPPKEELDRRMAKAGRRLRIEAERALGPAMRRAIKQRNERFRKEMEMLDKLDELKRSLGGI